MARIRIVGPVNRVCPSALIPVMAKVSGARAKEPAGKADSEHRAGLRRRRQDGLHYYVMQFIQGLGLDEVLVELRRLRRPNDPGLRTLLQSPQVRTEDASAVHAAHSLLTGSFASCLHCLA